MLTKKNKFSELQDKRNFTNYPAVNLQEVLFYLQVTLIFHSNLSLQRCDKGYYLFSIVVMTISKEREVVWEPL